MNKAPVLNHTFNVWTDGSYQPTRERGGIGAVILDEEGKFHSHSAPIPPLNSLQMNHGSDFAELYAVALTLKMFRDQSSVRLHMDCQNVIDWLEGGQLNCKNSDTRKALIWVFNYAMTGVRRIDEIEFIHLSDHASAEMKQANRLARAGANPLSPKRG